ncbi:MAG: urea carboxylase-associated family protein [Chloroflexi bacterium]|nr:urea carboxylase-associated family protein [Chloroflexota bacterium]
MGRGPLEREQLYLAQKADVPGDVVEEILIPARGYLPARVLKTGQIARVIDVEGEQVADVILWDANNLEDFSSCVYTLGIYGTWRISRGHSIYSRYCSKMATITDDTVGVHCFGRGFCNAELNALRYGVEATPNCRGNLAAAMGGYGFTRNDIQVDACFCLFMNFPYEADGRFVIREPVSKPGDYVDLLAERDLVMAVSNCPSERNPCNAYNPTLLKVVIYNPGKMPSE